MLNEIKSSYLCLHFMFFYKWCGLPASFSTGVRMEDFFYEKMDKKKRDRYTNAEQLGQVMIDSGNDYGPGTAYGEKFIFISTSLM